MADTQLSVDVYAPNAGALVGGPVTVLSASRTRRVQNIGDFQFVVPANHPKISLLTQGREIRLFRSGAGAISGWRGIIETNDIIWGPDNSPIATISGRTLGAELARANLGYGMSFAAVAASSALASVVGQSYVTWTTSVAGALNTITAQMDGMSVWQGALLVATIGGGYLRETGTARQLELKIANAKSGMRLTNAQFLDPVAFANNTAVGIIAGMPRYHEDGGAIVNRLQPFGAPQNGLIFDLAQSTRVTPYTIQNFQVGLPTQFGAITGALWPISVTPVTASAIIADTVVQGGPNVQNSIAVFIAGFSNITNGIAAITLGGKRAFRGQRTAAGSVGLEVWYVLNPQARDPAAINNVTLTVTALTASSGNVWVYGFYMANINTSGGAAYTIAINSGASAAPSVTIASDVHSYVINATVWAPNTALTPDGTAAGLVNTAPGATGAGEYVGLKVGAASITFTHALGVAGSWVSISISIPAYKNYYIEDSTSVTTYGRSGDVLNVAQLKVGDWGTLSNAANSLYDYAATELARRSALAVTYQFDVVGLPLGTWLPGDTIYVDFDGYVTDLQGSRVWKSLHTDMIIMDATDEYPEDGSLRWKITVAPVLRYSSDLTAALAKLSQNTNALNTR